MEFVIGGLAAASAGFFTNPLEVIKHQMELNKKSQINASVKKKHFLNVGYEIAKEEGWINLQKGLSPALGAHLVSYGIKLGTYQFGQNRGLTTNSDGEVNVTKSILMSSMGGLGGQYLSSPFYLVKTVHDIDNAQNNGNNDKKNSSCMDAVKKIYKEQGLRGFFRGATASLPRAFIGTTQLTSFAVAKECLNEMEMFKENKLATTMVAGIVAGVVLSMATTPFDVVLTSMYKQAIGVKPPGDRYNGYLDCMKKVYTSKGLKPFYSGIGPLYMKIGPHTMLCLVFWEEFKGFYEKHKDPECMEQKKLHPVPVDGFYEKIGFLSREQHSYTHIFEDHIDKDHTISVYWN